MAAAAVACLLLMLLMLLQCRDAGWQSKAAAEAAMLLKEQVRTGHMRRMGFCSSIAVTQLQQGLLPSPACSTKWTRK
jgi:hypothetical protein